MNKTEYVFERRSNLFDVGDKEKEAKEEKQCCRFSHLPTTSCAEAWASYAESLGAKKVLSFDAFKKVARDLLATTDSFSHNDDRDDFTCPDRLRHWFSKQPARFGDRIYHLTVNDSIERLGQALQEGLDRGWIKFNPSLMEYQVSNRDDSNTDLTGLMWQIALTNWETTKAELSTPQVAMMARLSLQALGLAVFPTNSRDYKPELVEKALNKTKLVVSELNTRMQNEQRSRLPEPS